MPATTTPDGIPYPVVGDKVGPLEKLFESLASGVQTALTNLRNETVAVPIPDPISIVGASIQAVSETAFADLPGITAIGLTLPAPAWVRIDLGSWVVSTAGDTRVSVRVTGATTLSETQLEVGGPTGGWGQVIYAAASPSTRQQSVSRIVRMNAGTNNVAVRAYRTGSGNHNANYTTLQVTPLRWA